MHTLYMGKIDVMMMYIYKNGACERRYRGKVGIGGEILVRCKMNCFFALVSANSCLCFVNAGGFYVERRSFFAGNEACQAQILPRFHKRLRPFLEPVAFVGSQASSMSFLRDNFSILVLHQLGFCLPCGFHFFP